MTFVERRKTWSFFILGDGSWVWRVLYPDGTEKTASRGFPTVEDCISDAKLNGYVVWDPAKERRKKS